MAACGQERTVRNDGAADDRGPEVACGISGDSGCRGGTNLTPTSPENTTRPTQISANQGNAYRPPVPLDLSI